jgi:hypothetical protein
MTDPVALNPTQPGNRRLGVGRRLAIICMASSSMKPTKKMDSERDEMRAASWSAKQGAEQDARRQLTDDGPKHGLMRVMSTEAGERGEQDGRHRSPERQMQHLTGRKALHGENNGQHRHDDHATAHPEQAGEETGARRRLAGKPG